MNAFIKTLIGDGYNLLCVAVVLLAAVALTATGDTTVAPYLIPPLTLAGIGWLARH